MMLLAVGFVLTVVAAILVKVLFSVWPMILRMIGRMHRRWKDHRSEKERHLNEAVVLTNCDNRHRGCVRRGEKIDEEKSKNYVPLGPCTVCGVHPSYPRDKNKSVR